MEKLFDIGEVRLNTELNIVKIIKTLMDNRILTKNYIMTNHLKKMIERDPKRLIDLDDSDDNKEIKKEKEKKRRVSMQLSL